MLTKILIKILPLSPLGQHSLASYADAGSDRLSPTLLVSPIYPVGIARALPLSLAPIAKIKGIAIVLQDSGVIYREAFSSP